MANIYRDLGRTSSLAVNATGITQLWNLDLSFLSNGNAMVEIETVVYDPLNNTTAVYFHTTGIYKNSSATVPSYTIFITESDYNYDGGDSRLLEPAYHQATNALSQNINVLLSGSRTVEFSYKIRLVYI